MRVAYYMIIRSHYYGSKRGPWRLLLDESGEPVTFTSRKEAMAVFDPNGLNHNEYACEFKVVSDANYSSSLIERRPNNGSSGHRTLPKN